MSPNTVDSLLEQIAAGDEQALKIFYAEHHSRIYNFAYKRLNDPIDAAEVMNQVMLEVWRNAERFEGRSKATTWVLGIAHHKIIDILRKRGRQKSEALDEDPVDENAPTALDLLSRQQDAEQLRICLERLSELHREVVHLAFFEDLLYSEIAEIVACPEGTVKTRMFHAKRALKRCLNTLFKD